MTDSLRHKAALPENDDVSIVIRLENFSHISTVYGPDAGIYVVAYLRQVIAEAVPGEAEIVPLGYAAFSISAKVSSFIGSSGGCVGWLRSICARVSRTPISVGQVLLCLAVSGELDAADAGRVNLENFGGQAVGSGSAWCSAYRSDMALTARVLAAIDNECHGWLRGDIGSDCLIVEWQSICDAEAERDALYHQARLGLLDRSGHRVDFGDLPELFEKMGFSDNLDAYLIDKVLEQLEQDPDVNLGVRVSAQRAGRSRWWQSVEARLTADISVARRLAFEIEEAAPFADMAAVSEFIGQVRRLGCKVVLCGFGRGFMSIRELLGHSPSFVKIDAMFLANITHLEQSASVLTHLAGLGQALSATVMVDGVNNAEQGELARRAGIRWQQGDACSPHGVSRPWRLRNSPGRLCLLDVVGNRGCDRPPLSGPY